ncbi:AEC family transporter [Magnetococcus sp. PR-3]|uniref:AEC family transporter n=1 Tax=Magnetococcus sp. PR-3 TaxID=3120355 RepID=UPI002FCDF241
MLDFLETAYFVAEVTGPIFLLVLLGALLRAVGVITPRFVDDSSRVVFLVALPVLVFMAIARADLAALYQPALLGYFCLGTIITFIPLMWMATRFISEPERCSAFVHGAFRGNYGIVALALSVNVFGDQALPQGAMILAVLVPLYNVLGVLAMTVPFKGHDRLSWGQVLRSTVTNPLILAVVLALPVALLQLSLPPILDRTGTYFSHLTLPLALLGVGGSLTWRGLKQASGLSTVATLLKLVILPALLTLGALVAGFRGQDAGMLFLAFASPTAAASFIMTKAMGGDGELAGHIIALSTALSVVSIGTGLFLLRTYGVI